MCRCQQAARQGLGQTIPVHGSKGAELCYRGVKQKQGDLGPLTPHTAPSQTPTLVPCTSYQLFPNYLLIENSSLFKGILQETNKLEDLTLVSSPPEEMGAFVVKFKLTKAGPGKEAVSMLDKLQLQYQLPNSQFPPGTFDERLRKTPALRWERTLGTHKGKRVTAIFHHFS